MKIIACGGLAQSGKTTLISHVGKLAFEWGYNPHFLSFAGPLKEAAERVGAGKEDRPELYRKLCQVIGSHLRDQTFCPPWTGPDYWVDLMRQNLLDISRKESLRWQEAFDIGHESIVLIDDVRYPNEMELLKGFAALTIFVDAGKRLTDLDAEWRKHPSEQMAFDYMNGKLPDDLFDECISSNQSESYFKEEIERLFPRWLDLLCFGKETL